MPILSDCKCCRCDECGDKPRDLVVKVTYPAADGEVILAQPDGFWDAVTTTCALPNQLNGVAHINLLDRGTGYTEAPEISIAGNASGITRIVTFVEGVTVSEGGDGYTRPPAVKFVDNNFVEIEEATASAVIHGAITKISVGHQATGYETPPTVKVCGGEGAVLTPVMDGYVDRISIVDPGSEYDPAEKPTVTLEGDGTGAEAGETVAYRAFVVGMTVTNGGRGYELPPKVVVLGAGRGVEAAAVVEFGRVVGITVVSAGTGFVGLFGAKVDQPVVELQLGGGVGATAEAVLEFRVESVSIDSSGEGYTSPPTVTLSGNASAESHLKFRLQSITVEDGGSGYPYEPAVAILGGGGIAPTATASISGSVTAVRLFNQGRYSNQYFESTQSRTEWPVIEFTSNDAGAGAEAEPVFAAVPLDAVFSSNGAAGDLGPAAAGAGYAEPPAITISGGGGSGAAAEAVLEWGQEQEFRYPIPAGCFATRQYATCLDTASTKYPGVPCLGCGGQSVNTGGIAPDSWVRFGERLGWGVHYSMARTGSAQVPTVGVNEFAGVTAAIDRMFPGEALWVLAYTRWAVLHDIAYSILGDQRERSLFLNRFYNRVKPSGTYGFPDQPDSATNAVLVPVLKQYSDLKGDPQWFIASFTIQSPGDNLLFLREAALPWGKLFGHDDFVVPTTGNIVGVGGPTSGVFLDEYVVQYSPPVVGAWETAAAFSVQPVLDFEFEPADGVGEYAIAAVNVTAGGETLAADGQYLLSITSLDHGHIYTAVNQEISDVGDLLLVVEDGQAVSVIVVSGGSIRGGASLVSVEFEHATVEAQEDDGRDAVNRLIIGSTANNVTIEYSEPTVTAEAATDGQAAVLEVTLEEQEDAAGNPYWAVAGVTVVDGGSGYAPGVEIQFTVEEDNGVEAVAANATGVLPAREQPTLTIASSGGGSGATFELEYEPVANAEPAQWAIASVAVVFGGTGGYKDYDFIFAELGEDDHVDLPATGQLRTVIEEPLVNAVVATGIGAALEVILTPLSNEFWQIQSVNVLAAGSGYEDGEPVTFTGGTWLDNFAQATIAVDQFGAITGVNVTAAGQFQNDTGVVESVELWSGGAYYKQPSFIESVDVQFGGRYFNRTVVDTGEPISPTPPNCLGDVGEWERRDYPRDPPWKDDGEDWEKWREVGDVWDSTAQTGCYLGGASGFPNFQRKRVCPPPTLEISLE